MSKYGIALATAGLSLIMAGQASAAETVFRFDGIATHVDDNKGHYVNFPTPLSISGTFKFDTTDFVLKNVNEAGVALARIYGTYTLTDSLNTSTGTGFYDWALVNQRVNQGGYGDSFQLLSDYNGLRLAYRTPQGSHLFSGSDLSFTQQLDLTAQGFQGSLIAPWSYNGGSFDPKIHVEIKNVPITAAVPEPETYAMLLAGLGLIGATVRRRKTQAA